MTLLVDFIQLFSLEEAQYFGGRLPSELLSALVTQPKQAVCCCSRSVSFAIYP